MDELILNLEKTATKCISFGVRKVRVSNIVYNKRVPNSFVDEANSKIISMCKHKSFEYILITGISLVYIYLTMAFICWSQVCVY